MLDLAGGGAMQQAYLPLIFWKIFTLRTYFKIKQPHMSWNDPHQMTNDIINPENNEEEAVKLLLLWRHGVSRSISKYIRWTRYIFSRIC